MLDLVFNNFTTQRAPGHVFFGKILTAAANELKIKDDLELSVNLTTPDKIQKLNKEHRGKNKPTDVLSFPMGGGNGDIFICLSIAKKDAKRENVSTNQMLARLTVHGFLHLQGYDHELGEKEAEEMFALEKKILNKLSGVIK